MKLDRVEVDARFLALALSRGSQSTQWFIGKIGRQFIRVIRSYDYPPGWHISASVGGEFGTLSSRPPTDAEMDEVIGRLGSARPKYTAWIEDNSGGDDPNVRHYWAEKKS